MKRLFLSQWIILTSLLKINWCHVRVYIWTLNSVPLIYIPILMYIPNYFCYYKFVVKVLKLGNKSNPTLLDFQDYFKLFKFICISKAYWSKILCWIYGQILGKICILLFKEQLNPLSHGPWWIAKTWIHIYRLSPDSIKWAYPRNWTPIAAAAS